MLFIFSNISKANINTLIKLDKIYNFREQYMKLNNKRSINNKGMQNHKLTHN